MAMIIKHVHNNLVVQFYAMLFSISGTEPEARASGMKNALINSRQ